MTILVIDNYDSFAYNLVQYVGVAVAETDAGPDAALDSTPDAAPASEPVEEPVDDVVVWRNDAISVEDIRDLDPDGIVVSPGPGTPEEAGVSVPIFAETEYPTLGVCLGHQALCAANGATVGHAPEVVHGKSSTVRHDGQGVFAGLPEQFEVGRYHSLSVEGEDLPEALVPAAWSDDGVLMAARHRERPHIGVQFHPESILTDCGTQIVQNFCELCSSDDFL